MELSPRERDLVIRALTKVLETEPAYARADEYKKLLDRMKDIATPKEDEQTDHVH